MHIVYKAFDDNTAELIDLNTCQITKMTEADLIRYGKNNKVIGLSISNNKINYINAYDILQFPTEDEAYEFIREQGLTSRNLMYTNGIFSVIKKSDHKYHVNYYVCAYAGDEAIFVADKGYTKYIQGAKVFDKRTAGKKAAFMRSKSKTGKYWTTYRVEV